MTSLQVRERPFLGAAHCPYHSDAQLFWKRHEGTMLYKVRCPWWGCEYGEDCGEWHEHPQQALDNWNVIFDPGKTDK